MEAPPRSGGKFGLKILYIISLLSLCVYVISGPATATSVICGGVTNSWGSNIITSGNGTVFVSGNQIQLFNVEYLFSGNGTGQYTFDILASVAPNSTVLVNAGLATLASGLNTSSASEFVAANAGSTNNSATLWSINTLDSSWEMLDVHTDSSGNLDLSGSFNSLIVPTANDVAGTLFTSDVDFFAITTFDLTVTPDAPPDNPTPEPATALPLLTGFGLVEYLRRKSRAPARGENRRVRPEPLPGAGTGYGGASPPALRAGGVSPPRVT